MIDNRKHIDINKRIGKFSITHRVISDFSSNRNPSNRRILSLIFSNVIIVEAISKYIEFGIEYTALSEHFFEIEAGTIPPYYDLIVENDSIITFKRIEDNKIFPTTKFINYITDRLERIGEE